MVLLIINFFMINELIFIEYMGFIWSFANIGSLRIHVNAT